MFILFSTIIIFILPQDASRLQSRIRYTQKNSSRSTPTSPSRGREPQCTCMTPEQVSSMRSQRNSRIRGSRVRLKLCDISFHISLVLKSLQYSILYFFYSLHAMWNVWVEQQRQWLWSLFIKKKAIFPKYTKQPNKAKEGTMYVCGNGPINAAITTTAIARSKRKRKFERYIKQYSSLYICKNFCKLYLKCSHTNDTISI